MRRVLFCIGLFGMTTFARADVIVYDNGAGGASAITQGIESDVTGPFRVAEDVELSTSTLVTRVSWTGIYGGFGPTATDAFTINVHQDASGLPGAVLASYPVADDVHRTPTGFNVSGLGVFEYSADIGYEFQGDVRYYVSIVNSTAESDWGWGAIVGSDLHASFQSFTSGQTWANLSSSVFDFRLHAVPEPATTLLALIVLSWSWIGSRSRRSSC
jgi:hypothetical protein